MASTTSTPRAARISLDQGPYTAYPGRYSGYPGLVLRMPGSVHQAPGSVLR
ncbi:MAG: hypothetical protein ACXV3S_00780 [Kineosporiaceae bacterium]